MASWNMMSLPDSTSVQTPEVPKLLSNVIFGAFEVTAPVVHDGGGGGMMPPQLLIQPVPGLGVVVSGAVVSGVVAGAVVSGAVSAGQLMATETPPFLMSTENE